MNDNDKDKVTDKNQIIQQMIRENSHEKWRQAIVCIAAMLTRC